MRLIQWLRGPTSPSGTALRKRPSGAPKVSNTSCGVSRGMLPTSNSCSCTDVTCFPPAHSSIARSRSVPGATASDFRSAATEDRCLPRRLSPGRQHHHHLAAFEARFLLDFGELGGVVLDAIEELIAQFLMRHFTPAEPQR